MPFKNRRRSNESKKPASTTSYVTGIIGIAAMLICALVLFGAFYPLESGLPSPVSYARHLRWFKCDNY